MDIKTEMNPLQRKWLLTGMYPFWRNQLPLFLMNDNRTFGRSISYLKYCSQHLSQIGVSISKRGEIRSKKAIKTPSFALVTMQTKR